MSTRSASNVPVASFVSARGARPGRKAVVWLSGVLLGGLLGCSGDEGSEERDVETLQDTNALGAQTEQGQAAEAVMDEASQLMGTGSVLTVTEGWVPNSSNGLGIQGAFFTYGDGSGRTEIAEQVGGSTTGGYCVAGESGQVIDGDFGGTWGAVAALNLRQQVGVETAGAYNARQNGVIGFGFDIVGTTGGLLRFVSKQFNIHDGFCATTQIADCTDGCSVEVMLGDMTQNCWEAGGELPRVAEMSAIEWQITTAEAGATPFDYCIENIHAVLGTAD